MSALALSRDVRAFVAVEVPPRPDDPTAAAPEHLTLRFLGELDPANVPRVTDALRPVARATSPFDLHLEGIGAFPSPDRPRVVWIGATDGSAQISSLAQSVAAALAPIVGDGSNERFVPHVTLFRVRSRADRVRADALLAGRTPTPPPRDVRIREFVLKQSILSHRGAEHSTVAAFALGAPATD